MSGLSVLYAKEATREAGWTRISARNRTKRLREVYWARQAGRDVAPEAVHGHGTQQRRAADQVIEQVRTKLAKRSYQELVERYGYGTLVVGMPLWFAVPADDPFRPANVLDDFVTRDQRGSGGTEANGVAETGLPISGSDRYMGYNLGSHG